MPGGPAQVPRPAKSPQRKVILHAPQLLSHPLPPVPDRPGSAGSPVFRRGALRRFSPAVRPGGPLPRRHLSAGVRLAASAGGLHPRLGPAEDLSLPEENDPFQGVFLSLDQLADAQTLADGYDGVILPMKTADGALGYVSALPLAADAGASSGDPDRNEVLRALNDTPGLYTVAQVSCLRDSALVREEPGLSLHRVSGSPWLDESRQGWLDPAQPQVQSYLIGLCRELAQLGFDEILLTDCGFPTQGDLDSLRAVEEKEETLETFCRQLQGALADTPVTLSVMGQRDSVTADPVSGQTTALLATFGRVWTQAEDQEALAAFDPVVLPAVS